MKITLSDSFVTYEFTVNESTKSISDVYRLILEALYPLKVTKEGSPCHS